VVEVEVEVEVETRSGRLPRYSPQMLEIEGLFLLLLAIFLLYHSAQVIVVLQTPVF
jgi:hypothetical protein